MTSCKLCLTSIANFRRRRMDAGKGRGVKGKYILSVNWRHVRLNDLVSAKGKIKVSWLISFHSLIRQCFNILIRHCNPSRIRNIN